MRVARRVRSQIVALSVLALGTKPATAQLLGPWTGWENERANMVGVGYGADAGILGARYARALGQSPWAVGAGAGEYGVTPYVELGLESRLLPNFEQYVNVGLILGWAPINRGGGALALEAGERMWFANGHLFLDAGLGLAPRLWGRSIWPLWGLAVPHAQLGIAF